MARDLPGPLSTEEAKARLRAAAKQAGPTAWVQHHPLHAVGIALLGGFVAGRLRPSSVGGLLLAQKLVTPLLLGMTRSR